MRTSHSKWKLNSVIAQQQKFALFLMTLFLCGIATATVTAQQDNNRGAAIFPKSTDAFVHVTAPAQLIDKLLEHPLRETIESLPQVEEGLKSNQMKQFRIGLAFLETRIGEEWLPALKKLTEKGIYFGADLKTQNVGIAFQASDEQLLKKTAGEILGFIKQQGGEKAIEFGTYRSGKIAELENDVVVARFGDWFLISNKTEFLKSMADNLLDGVDKPTENCLIHNQQFTIASKSISRSSGQSDAWGYVDLDLIRKAGDSKDLFAGSTDEPAVELLFGGILEGLKDAKFVASSFSFDHESVSLKSVLPFDAKSFAEPREFFFGDQAEGRAPAPLDVPGLLGQVVAYRDLGGWWLSKEDLFPENVIAQLSQSDSELSTFFGGADFGQDILGALQPGLRIVFKEQQYADELNPDVKIPAFAMVGRLRDPNFDKRFKRAFTSLVAFVNLGAMEGQPAMDAETFREDGVKLTVAEYDKSEVTEKGMLAYNFQPAIAFQDDYIILSSNGDFALELAKATKALGDNPAASQSNVLIELNGKQVKKQLTVNRESLIAQSMVSGGKSRKQSSQEVDLVLSILDYAKDAKLDYQVHEKDMTLDVQLNLAIPKK